MSKTKNLLTEIEWLGLVLIGTPKDSGDLIETFKIVKCLSGIRPEVLFHETLGSRTRRDGKKLIKHRSQPAARGHFFSNGLVNWCNKLARSAVGSHFQDF